MKHRYKETISIIKQKAPIHIWIVGLFALFINSIGGYDFIMTLSQNKEYFNSLGYGSRQIEYFTNYPIALIFFWFLGVWAAIAGSICILLKLKTARTFFLISIFGQVVLSFFTFFFKNRWEILGSKLGYQDLIVLAFTVTLGIYSHYLIKRKIIK